MIAAVVEIVAPVIDTLEKVPTPVVVTNAGVTFVSAIPPDEYVPDATISSVPRLVADGVPEPGVPILV
jgi:hypothetical protein